ncbi:MAG: hypothetical protein ACRD6X_05385 [Pyrinomonadaceae bacterium]
MRTTITLDDDVVITVKEEMKKGDGKTFKEAVNELIRIGRYHKAEIEKTPRKLFKVKAKNLGVYPHLNYDKTSELLSILDEEELKMKNGRS